MNWPGAVIIAAVTPAMQYLNHTSLNAVQKGAGPAAAAAAG